MSLRRAVMMSLRRAPPIAIKCRIPNAFAVAELAKHIAKHSTYIFSMFQIHIFVNCCNQYDYIDVISNISPDRLFHSTSVSYRMSSLMLHTYMRVIEVRCYSNKCQSASTYLCQKEVKTTRNSVRCQFIVRLIWSSDPIRNPKYPKITFY